MAKKGQKFNKYSPEFKKEAVEKYLSGEIGGLTIAARKLGLRNKAQLLQWTRLYKKDPELLKKDGRTLGPKDGVIKGRPKKQKLDELSKDEQIEYLKMKNAILKKAKALRESYGER
ncbi:MAG: transposase [Erysipelotrichaceae bacterium]|nr:transposase [Erysipelotrichaceae bacterium]